MPATLSYHGNALSCCHFSTDFRTRFPSSLLVFWNCISTSFSWTKFSLSIQRPLVSNSAGRGPESSCSPIQIGYKTPCIAVCSALNVAAKWSLYSQFPACDSAWTARCVEAWYNPKSLPRRGLEAEGALLETPSRQRTCGSCPRIICLPTYRAVLDQLPKTTSCSRKVHLQPPRRRGCQVPCQTREACQSNLIQATNRPIHQPNQGQGSFDPELHLIPSTQRTGRRIGRVSAVVVCWVEGIQDELAERCRHRVMKHDASHQTAIVEKL